MWPTDAVTDAPRTPPPWPIYEAGRDRLVELVRALDANDLERPVTLTPGWNIAEVLAHVCGLNADVAEGMRVGLGTPERTTYQVATRAGQSVEEVASEWLGHAGAMRSAMRDDPFFGHRLTADLTTHLHDVMHHLGEPVDRDDLATRCGAQTYDSVVTQRLLDQAGITLQIELTSEGTDLSNEPSPGADLTLRASAFDFLRSATGRRSAVEVRALDWSADPSAALEWFSPYGPLRDTDAGF